MSSPDFENYQWLKNYTLSEGAALFGVMDAGPFRETFLLSEEETAGLKNGVSMAVPLSPSVLAGIRNAPTLLYKWHYQQANNLLDKMAFRLTERIMEKGYRALPIPASQLVDPEGRRGHLSHRAVAERAGLGWRGRNNLTVNERYGSAIRLVTVLTDLPLSLDRPAEFQCGSCEACVRLCPAGALGGSSSEYRIETCHEMLSTFSKHRGIGVHICGVCVKACFLRKPGNGTGGA
jgi:epoxyqueuosine reductase QueG